MSCVANYLTVVCGLLLAAAVEPAVGAQTPARDSVLSAQVPVPGAPTGVTAFVDVAVIPMDTERILRGQTVLVMNGRITAIGPASQLTIPANATRIDGRGKYLMPGLTDMHVHLFHPSQFDPTRAEYDLLTFLANGLTTIRNLDYTLAATGPVTLALRARAAAGTLLSPRIYTSGLWGHFDTTPQGTFQFSRTNTQPQDVAAQIAAYKAAGYDFIKDHAENNITTPHGLTIWDSLVTVARRLDVPIVGHVANNGGKGGWVLRDPRAMRSVEHLSAFWPEIKRPDVLSPEGDSIIAKIPVIISAIKQAGVWTCPMLATALQFMPGGGLTEIHDDWKPKDKKLVQLARGTVKMLQDSAAGILLGTDNNPVNGSRQNYAPVVELRALVMAGLTPYQALVTGTRNPAAYFGILDQTGTVTIGKRADLVLLNGNPLQDINQTAHPAGVMIGGRWLSRTELDRRLAILEGNAH